MIGRWRTHWFWRWLVSTGVFTASTLLLDGWIHGPVQVGVELLAGLLRVGGADFDWSRTVRLIPMPGPFHGSLTAKVLNSMWWYGPWVVTALCAAIAAFATYRLLTD